MAHCEITIYNRQREVPLKLNSVSIQDVVDVVLASEQQQADFLSLHFLSDRLMRQYHKKFFQDDSATDCMSFPIDIDDPEATPRILGDIFICPQTALTHVKGCPHSFWEELTLYLVHGLLHLIGYEDTSASSRTIMRKKEKQILSMLKERGSFISGILHVQRT